MPLDYKLIGTNIKTRRKELQITQEQMADELFLSLSLISKLERGVKAVSMDTFYSIAEYLHTSIASLISDPNDPGVQHNQMIQEIDVMLEDLDNRHLRIVNQLMKTYVAQLREIYPAENAADRNSFKP
ncbi:MAG: helix-turn-helix transcriptional regulator [Eubacterium sp.]|jgi:transcriptional regulator with XRE-family HTH domain|nr:helix-turn-helix transcriptional regulator [Eubacterium sp.]